jgi:hypothetical protein
MAFKSRERQGCSVHRCRRPVVTCCFECDRPCCDHHLTHVWLPFLNNTRGFLVCPTCLDIYAHDPTLIAILSWNRLAGTHGIGSQC